MGDNSTGNKRLVISQQERMALTIVHGAGCTKEERLPADIEIREGGSLEIVIVSLSGGDSAADGGFSLATDIRLTGENASCRIYGAAICKGNDGTEMKINVRHLAENCTSTQSFRTIASGNAKCGFHGKITVAPGAQRTEAYQESHGILLSENARIETLPQLEIYADDVKCSHGATIGKLDENQIFYMRSRGISEKNARDILLRAFVSPIIGMIHEATDKERIGLHVDNLLISI